MKSRKSDIGKAVSNNNQFSDTSSPESQFTANSDTFSLVKSMPASLRNFSGHSNKIQLLVYPNSSNNPPRSDRIKR